ncbi:Alpha/Beta hydrolase protein [Mycena vitilis]|nr:Alpha/Beta hydrolase protein [Mycena vitilis]
MHGRAGMHVAMVHSVRAFNGRDAAMMPSIALRTTNFELAIVRPATSDFIETTGYGVPQWSHTLPINLVQFTNGLIVDGFGAKFEVYARAGKEQRHVPTVFPLAAHPLVICYSVRCIYPLAYEMNYAFSFALLVSLFSNEPPDVCLPAEPVVELSYGSFQGTAAGNLTQFLGIPFAKPPQVLEFCFSAQRKPDQQYRSISEDCLTINVLKPAQQSHDLPRPVLVVHCRVFIYLVLTIYSGFTEVARKTYRDRDTELPPEPPSPNHNGPAFVGFLAGKEIMDDGVENLVLRDQQLALELVQAHILAFGGDPNRVIVHGAFLVKSQPTGALLNVQPTASQESGATSSIPHVLDGQPRYDQLVPAMNCTAVTDTLDCLRHAPFDVLMSAINRTPNVFSYPSVGNVWKPRVHGDVLKLDPFVALARGHYAKVWGLRRRGNVRCTYPTGQLRR